MSIRRRKIAARIARNPSLLKEFFERMDLRSPMGPSPTRTRMVRYVWRVYGQA